MKTKLWKLKRELKRVAQKISGGAEVITAPYVQKYRDLTAHQDVYDGSTPVHPDFIIILLFPKHGVSPSTLEQLDYCIEQNLTPIVVVNGKLQPEDRDNMLARSYLVIERPNHGYDFGGYRAGVIELINRKRAVENLFIINDSIWFPLETDCELIEKARTDPSDLFGIFYNERPKQPHRSHLQSYFYRFSSSVVHSDEFKAYWTAMTAYNNKDLTVRRNEMRLTHWFKSRGFTVGYMYNQESLHESLKNLNVEERVLIAKYQIDIGDKKSALVRARLESGGHIDDKIYFEDVINGVYGRYFLISHPLLLNEKMNCPVLKKDKQKPYKIQRDIYLNCAAAKNLPEHTYIEIREIDQYG